jgi:hypothetical protein
MIWEKLLMIYTQYHEGQQQSGVYKDNIRFIPKAIGDLVLLHIAYVLLLRQLFLQQQTPGALISPHLWTKLDRTVWVDGTLTACLQKACTQAQVPCLHTSNWRQFATSITKEKISVKERANFDLEESVGGILRISWIWLPWLNRATIATTPLIMHMPALPLLL